MEKSQLMENFGHDFAQFSTYLIQYFFFIIYDTTLLNIVPIKYLLCAWRKEPLLDLNINVQVTKSTQLRFIINTYVTIIRDQNA